MLNVLPDDNRNLQHPAAEGSIAVNDVKLVPGGDVSNNAQPSVYATYSVPLAVQMQPCDEEVQSLRNIADNLLQKLEAQQSGGLQPAGNATFSAACGCRQHHYFHENCRTACTVINMS